MTEKFPTREERDLANLALSERLRKLGFDGPVELASGDVLSAMFGAQHAYAVCLGCGTPVFLNDPMERPGRPEPIERAIFLHAAHHTRIGDPMPRPEDQT